MPEKPMNSPLDAAKSADPSPPGVSPVFLMLGGYGILSVQPLPVRRLAQLGFSTPIVVLTRFALAAFFVVAFLIALKRKVKTAQPGLLLFRGISGGLAVLLYFEAVQSGGAARATLLNYTYPLWANLFAHFLGRKATPRFWFWLATASLGVGIVLMPEGAGWTLGYADATGLLSGMVGGMGVLAVERLRRTDDSITILASFSLFGLISSLPLLALSGPAPPLDREAVLLLLAVGVTSFFGHWLFTSAYRRVSLRLGSALSLIVPVLTALFSLWWLHEPITPRFWLGGGVLLISLHAISRCEAKQGEGPAGVVKEPQVGRGD